MATHAALVTGASTGIGHAIAQTLLEDGYGVTICSRTPERIEAAAAELAAHGDVLAVTADVSDEADVARLLDAHEQRFGRLDVLVNNAGAGAAGPLTQTPVAQLDATLASNVRSAWLVSAAATPLLRAAGAEHGRALIATTASVLGRYAQAWSPAYSASKAALFALSQSLQHELAGAGVRATVIAPAYVATPMTAPLERLNPDDLITPQDVAEVVRFLTRLSRTATVPEVQLLGPSDHLLAA
jgi:NAD(P)-dependent dehydrogenase (short-subunit alcohol dehydrogenase family)